MKVLLTQKSLAAALDTAKRVVKKSPVPILGNVHLTASSSSLAIRATDLDREIALSADAEVAAEGATTVPAHLLHDIVRKLPAGSEIVFEADDDNAVVKSGRSRFKLQVLPAPDFPDHLRGDFDHSFTITGGQVRSTIGAVAFAMSRETTRSYLCGVYMHVLADEMRIVATCGHRLARTTIDAPAGSERIPGVIVPHDIVTELLKLVGKRDVEVVVEVSFSQIRFTIGDTVLTSKLVDGSYPDYQRVIPTGNNQNLRLDRASFAAAVDRVSTVASEKGRGVRIELGSEIIRLSVSAPDAGTATEEIDASFDGQPFEIGVNAKYLSGMLGAFSGDTIEWSLADPGSPTVMTDPDDASRLCVLMPMRV